MTVANVKPKPTVKKTPPTLLRLNSLVNSSLSIAESHFALEFFPSSFHHFTYLNGYVF